jgi:uncharacterized protein
MEPDLKAGRTRIRRLPEKAVTQGSAPDPLPDAGLVGHLAIAVDGQPYALPVGCAGDGDRALVHGSTGSRLFRTPAAGALACLTVTLLDRLVVARSAFESSMHYRSAMVLGRGAADRGRPARGAEGAHRAPTAGPVGEATRPATRELAATMVLALPLDEWSVKVSDGPPADPESDLDASVWAGVVPIVTSYGTPVPAADLRHRDQAPD